MQQIENKIDFVCEKFYKMNLKKEREIERFYYFILTNHSNSPDTMI